MRKLSSGVSPHFIDISAAPGSVGMKLDAMGKFTCDTTQSVVMGSTMIAVVLFGGAL